jgi:hypothetical protein
MAYHRTPRGITGVVPQSLWINPYFRAGAYASERSMELLQACLSPAQRKELEATGRISVTGSRGGKYAIDLTQSWSGNVLQFDERGRVLARLCCHSREQLPAADHFLLQKLAIEADEDRFLKTAYV